MGVHVCVFTCSGVDKLQNQRPAGDDARPAGQKIPSNTQKTDVKPCTYVHHNQVMLKDRFKGRLDYSRVAWTA